MRPHRLTMKAFGPFADRTVVDFDAMGDSIYLISGDTGSGKTTIFDGIIYALYGTASGGARSGLGTEALHSDYAKDGTHRDEMYVEFTFSNAGRTYTAARRMFWGKKGDSKTVSRESTLSEGGNTIVHSKGKEEKDEVTSRVTEILGLDADQFRRIIMLAQGEFQKFLTAGSDERGRILGKLYDNRRHQDFQLRLKAAADLLKKQDSAAVDEAQAKLSFFQFPKEAGEEEKSAVAVDHPSLFQVVREMILQMEEDLAGVQKKIQEQEKRQSELVAQKTRGEAANRLLDDLDEKKAQLTELDKKEKQVTALRNLVTLAENAGRVIPAERAMQQADSEWEAVLEKIRHLEEERDRLAVSADALKAGLEQVEKENAPQIMELQKKQAAVREVLHFYDDLEKSIGKQREREKVLESASGKVGAAEAMLSEKQNRQQELTKMLQRLEAAGPSAAAVARRAFEDAGKRKKDLEALHLAIRKTRSLAKEEEKLKEAFGEAGKAELEAEKKHLRLNEAFIHGQAGILAQDMRDKLRTEPEVTCPVCGSVHTAADTASFAERPESIPAKEDVDLAYEAWNQARQSKDAAEKAWSEKKTALLMQKEAALQKAADLLPSSEWEELTRGSVLSDAITESVKLLADARFRYQEAEADAKAKEKASSEKEAVDEQVSAADKALKDARQALSDAQEKKAVADTEVKSWRRQLQGYPETKEEAQTLRKSLENRESALQKQVDGAKERLSSCVSSQDTNRGSLATACLEKEGRRKEREMAAGNFAAGLEKQSFADRASYHRALSPEGELLDQEKLLSWISRKKEEIDEFNRSRQTLDASVRQLAESTRGMERTDIQAIERLITGVLETLKEWRTTEKDLSARIRTDRDVLRTLLEIEDRRAQYRKIYGKLVPLADAANSNYAFSRYVLSGFFHRIVEQANIHLDTLTDGEYCLVPKETGDGRKTIGLDLKVLNTITNLERDTASLSGGQLFEASLSLALGLSDVVQMESTSRIRIDSMFIDEGFGSLDGGRLDKAISVLQHLSAGKRQIGIISHVARLDECLPRKIHVIAGERGSTVRIETDA